MVDVLPTILDLSDVEYPKTFKGNAVKQLQGESFATVLENGSLENDRQIFWEHQGNGGVREGDLKAVRLHNEAWELYGLSMDPTELNDLAQDRPQVLSRLKNAYQQWAIDNGVLAWPIKKAD